MPVHNKLNTRWFPQSPPVQVGVGYFVKFTDAAKSALKMPMRPFRQRAVTKHGLGSTAGYGVRCPGAHMGQPVCRLLGTTRAHRRSYAQRSHGGVEAHVVSRRDWRTTILVAVMSAVTLPSVASVSGIVSTASIRPSGEIGRPMACATGRLVAMKVT